MRVLHPGRRVGGPGPDFRDAVVTVDGVERRGDVELHVRASAFRSHGHANDAAYARLALHVVYRADEGAETPLALGGSVPVAAFEPWLHHRASELQRWLTAPDAWAEPCRDAALRLGDEAVDETLRRFGEERFQGRMVRMAESVRRVRRGRGAVARPARCARRRRRPRGVSRAVSFFVWRCGARAYGGSDAG